MKQTPWLTIKKNAVLLSFEIICLHFHKQPLGTFRVVCDDLTTHVNISCENKWTTCTSSFSWKYWKRTNNFHVVTFNATIEKNNFDTQSVMYTTHSRERFRSHSLIFVFHFSLSIVTFDFVYVYDCTSCATGCCSNYTQIWRRKNRNRIAVNVWLTTFSIRLQILRLFTHIGEDVFDMYDVLLVITLWTEIVTMTLVQSNLISSWHEWGVFNNISRQTFETILIFMFFWKYNCNVFVSQYLEIDIVQNWQMTKHICYF